MKKKKEGSKDLSRRSFIGTVGAATAGVVIVPRNVLGGKGYKSPSDMINVAGIGIGARGASDIRGVADPDVADVERISRPRIRNMPYSDEELQAYLADPAIAAAARAREQAAAPAAQQRAQQQESEPPRKLANIFALCDVDTEKAAHVFKGYPKAKVYTDWREMLEKEKSIDAVVIGTPDHNHAPIAAAFMREKKHIYVEKPLCKTVVECRTLAKLAKEYDVVTQMGNQGHATEGTRQTVEWVQSGVIGVVNEVALSTNRPSWPQGNFARPPAMPIPKNLNYDVWLGPAPDKPYNPAVLHFNWRGLWDYGTGAMGDMGAHIFDAPIWALNLGMPTKIQATSSPFSDDYLPKSTMVTYEFAERFTQGIGYMPPLKVTWCDGGLRPARPSELEAGRAIMDATYYGDKGIIMHRSHGAVPELVPLDEDFAGVEPWLPRTGDIFEDWIGAILAGKKSCNDFAYSTKVTEIMLLTNIALLTKGSHTTLEYDAENMKITNLEEANQYFHYEYRNGWTL